MRTLILALLVAGFVCPTGRCAGSPPGPASHEQYSRWSGLWFPEGISSSYIFESWRSTLYADLLMRESDLDLFLKTNSLDAVRKAEASSASKSFFERGAMISGFTWPEKPPGEGYFLSSPGGSQRLDVMVLVVSHPEEASSGAEKDKVYRVFIKAGRFPSESDRKE